MWQSGQLDIHSLIHWSFKYRIAGNFAGRAVTAKIKAAILILALPCCVYDFTRSHVRVRPQKRKHTKTKTLDRLHVCAGEDRLSRGVDMHNINERCIGRTYKDPVGGERYVLKSRCILGSF